MQKNDFLFVYGTLRRGERMDLADGKMGWGVRFIGPDRINGHIYHVPGASFPGVKPGATSSDDSFSASMPSVFGDLFMLRDNDVHHVLDAYEGYPYLYNRSQFQTETGKTAWVYTYNGDLPEEALIPSCDWKDR